MRFLLMPAALVLILADPAWGSPEGATGGLPMPSSTTGGMTVPGEPNHSAPAGIGVSPAGGAQLADPAGPPGAGQSARDGAARVRGQAAQEGQPDLPTAVEEPDQGDVEVRVPVDGDSREPGATPSIRSGTPLEGVVPTGLARSGLAVAAVAMLGAGAAAAGLALRRLAR